MAEALVLFEELLSDLRHVRRLGIGSTRGVALVALRQAAAALGFGPEDDNGPSPVRELLMSATIQVEPEDLRLAVRYTLGLVDGSSTWPVAVRRDYAARCTSQTAETYRRRTERRLLRQTAEVIFQLVCDQMVTRRGRRAQAEPAAYRSELLESGSRHTISDPRANRESLETAEHFLFQASMELVPADRERFANQVLQLLVLDDGPVARTLKARALKMVADIRRDEGHLSGARGAYQIYGTCEALLAGQHEPDLSTQLILVRASCQEMSGLNAVALKTFTDAELASGVKQPRYESWAHLRKATNLVKLGHADDAYGEILASIRSSAEIDSLSWRSEQLMKLSAVNIARKRYDLAVQNAEDARDLIETPTPLAALRRTIQLSDALIHDHEFGASKDLIQSATSIAIAKNYSHQLLAIMRLVEVHPEIEPPSDLIEFVSKFAPLRPSDIAG